MKIKYYIFILVTSLLTGACSDDIEQEPANVSFCVRAVWENGRGGSTRTLSSLLNEVNGKALMISPDEYPEEIQVECSGKEFKLTKTVALEECDEHDGFYHNYISEYRLKDIEAKRGVTATAVMADGDELYSEKEDVELDGVHLKFIMHHRKALVRFLFKVDDKYDKIRYIKVKNVTLLREGSDSPEFTHMRDGGLVLTETGYICAGYCYINPSEFTANTPVQISCIYDIYDKDSSSGDEHITRKDVTATNIITFGKDGSSITSIKAGYYYDLNITINPDYLYVLSEHDNKHITIE